MRRNSMLKTCPVCDYPFKDGDLLVAVMLSSYKEIESDVHYAITTPTECVEVIHRECYDFPESEGPNYIGGVNG